MLCESVLGISIEVNKYFKGIEMTGSLSPGVA